MKLPLAISIMFLSLFGLSNCQKKCGFGEINGDVEIFLLKEYEREEGGCQIISSSVELENEPFILYEQLLEYDQDTYIFSVDDTVIELIKAMDQSVSGTPFAIVADDEIVYTAYFWPSYSSLSCEWYTVDPVMIEYDGGMKVNMGYPGGNPDPFDGDLRNDERILNIFARDNKLK